jgi:hypothetical protein
MSGAAARAVLPEQSGVQPPAQIQAIYRELCVSCGVAMPALIFRNLATRPGVLEAFWQCLGPLYRQGLLQQSAWELAGQAAAADLLPALEAHERHAFGLHDGQMLRSTRATLDNYNRANPVNWLALLSLLEAARQTPKHGAARAEQAAEQAWQPPAPPSGELLPLPAADELDARTRWLLNDLREGGDRSELDPVVPSLYRHLSACPGLLDWLHRHLAPRFADGRMTAELRHLRQGMQQEARGWAERLEPLPAALLAADVLETVEQFAHQVIAPMVLIGTALQRAIDAGPDASQDPSRKQRPL